MSELDRFIGRAQGVVARGRGLTWGIRGLAAGALLALLFELLQRRFPVDPAWPGLAACAALAVIVAAGGWLRAWPSRLEVARLADLRLGGRERLATAVELAGSGGLLVLRQRSDAENFAAGAEPRAVRDPGLPVRAAALAAVAALAAGALALAPNQALNALRQQRADQAAQQKAAADIGQLITKMEAKQAASPDPRRAQLIQDLKQGQQSVAKAPDPQTAVANLSQTQQQIQQLQDPSVQQKQQGEAAAGQQLQGAPGAAGKAGQAMAQGDSKTAAAQLHSAAQSVGQLTPQERAQLAQQLQQAAQAAQQNGNSQLASSLQQASDALQQGDDAAAQQALDQASAQESQLASSQDVNGDLAQASNSLQGDKSSLAAQAQADAQGAQGSQTGQGSQSGQGSQPGQGSSAGQGGKGSQGNQGSGNGGQGNNGGNAGQGGNSGSGSGSGGQGGSGNGGGQGGSAKGGVNPNEQVYVPGQSTGSGNPQGNINDPNNQGTSTDLVPYSSVYSQYQSEAQSEVDRELIPQDERDLVQNYFQDLTQQ